MQRSFALLLTEQRQRRQTMMQAFDAVHSASSLQHGLTQTLVISCAFLEHNSYAQNASGLAGAATYLLAVRPVRARDDEQRLREVLPAGLRRHSYRRRLIYSCSGWQLHRHVRGVLTQVRLRLTRLPCRCQCLVSMPCSTRVQFR